MTEKPNPPRRLEIKMQGMIGEKTELFSKPIKQVDEIYLDMQSVTYINSIGVKNWISWTMKVPLLCKVFMLNCPFVIAAQASSVHGFLTKSFSVESFYAPFTCPKCQAERIELLKRGQHFEYKTATHPEWVKLPKDLKCGECGELMEPDFFQQRALSFVTR